MTFDPDAFEASSSSMAMSIRNVVQDMRDNDRDFHNLSNNEEVIGYFCHVYRQAMQGPHPRPRLTQIRFEGDEDLPDTALDAIADIIRFTPALQKVTFKYFSGAQLQRLTQQLDGIPALETLRIEDMGDSQPGEVGEAVAGLIKKAGLLRGLELSKPQFREQDWLSVEAAAKASGRLKELLVSQVQLRDAGSHALGRTVQANPGINKLEVRNCTIAPGVMTALAEEIAGHPALEELVLTNNGLGRGDGAALATMLDSLPRLRTLRANNNQLDDREIAPVADALAHNKTLWKIVLSSNNMGYKGAKHLADAVYRKNRTLCSVIIGQNDLLEEVFTDTLEDNYSANLLRAFPIHVGSRHTGGFRENHDIAEEIAAAWVKARPSHAEQVRRMESRRNAILGYRDENDHFAPGLVREEDYERFMASLPVTRLQPEDPGYVRELFTPQESGFAPVDNPRQWKSPEALFDALGRMDLPVAIRQRSPQGTTLLQAAAFAGAGHGVVNRINRYGLSITPADLLDGAGGPNESYLELSRCREELVLLFARQNLVGQGYTAAHRLYNALPEPQRKEIPGRMQVVQNAAPVRENIMRGAR